MMSLKKMIIQCIASRIYAPLRYIIYAPFREKVLDDNFIKKTKFNSRSKKLEQFFACMTTAQVIDIDFFAIFEAKTDDKRNFCQILGVKRVKSDLRYFKIKADSRSKVIKLIREFDYSDRALKRDCSSINFQNFIAYFGRIPYCYFKEAADLLIDYGKYNNCAELLTDAFTNFDRFTERINLTFWIY